MTKLPRVSEARKAFARNVARHQERGESEAELAERINVEPSTWASWKSGRRGGLPATQTLLHCAKAFSCLVEELLDGVDPDYEPLREYRLGVLRLTADPVTGLFLPATPAAAPAPSPVESEAPSMDNKHFIPIGLAGESLTHQQRVDLAVKCSEWIAGLKSGRVGGATGTGDP